LDAKILNEKCLSHLQTLCQKIPERCVGSEGNRQATHYFEKIVSDLGWQTEMPEFDVIDWEDNGATLQAANENFQVYVSPYSPGCNVHNNLIDASSIDELESKDIKGKILLLHGDIAREQLMPKNFVFYNPDRHQKIITLLEQKQPAAIITATGRNAALAGGVYPFPMIEDGDFDIPSVYMTEEEGKRLLSCQFKSVMLHSRSRRIPAQAYNVIAGKGNNPNQRIVFTAHIDAKKGSPGAIDNATGVVIQLLLAELLKNYTGARRIEIVAFNGEDYYAAPGQMNYIRNNQNNFKEMILNINIDGAGYKEGKSSFSFFDLPVEIRSEADRVVAKFEGITEGPQWPQGDHSIFLQKGCPAIAISSLWLLENMEDQNITHTPADNIEIVDSDKLVELAKALAQFINKIG
jgi:aminopeptidase YwaD